MTNRYFFDTDCISAFLWIKGESILAKLYSGKIILPTPVYRELQKVPHLSARIDTLKQNGDLFIQSIEAGSAEYYDYVKMTTSPEPGMKIIGKGEAAAIAMARMRNGILASNNMRDISAYVTKYNLQHITTGDILLEALKQQLITESEGNPIWAAMLRKKRRLPTLTFSDYICNN